MPNDPENAAPTTRSSQQTFVVALGASAGGIKPLTEFFSRVRPDSDLAYVVILHLSPEYESNLSAVLQSKTSVPVTQVTSAIAIEPNHIYVIPPSKNLVMNDGLIRPTDLEGARSAHTIDLCFRTLADVHGRHAIAILLSGTGADGTLGIGRVKEEGGFVIAQNPAEADYPDMPRSAIATGMVDLVMPVAEMPAKVVALRDGARRLEFPLEPGEKPIPADDEGVLRELLTILRLRTGNDFAQYKRPTLLRRIARRLQVNELSDLRSYLELLRARPEEIQNLLRDLLITVTNFFRDADAFETLKTEVIPALFAGKGPHDQVRVWSAGCASGEEAYSLAMLLAEYSEHLAEPPKIQIFATDIDEPSILEGRECRYPSTVSIDVSPERLHKYFNKIGDAYQVKKQLRENVLFALHNVIRDPPFTRLDLISCRNLLIYFNREMQERVLEIFHFGLRHGGYLFLGSSESAEMNTEQFLPIDKKRRLYLRRDVVGKIENAPGILAAKWPIRVPEPFIVSDHANSAGQLHQQMVERFAPPSVLTDENYDVLHVSTHAARYLQVSGGEPTHSILKLVIPEMRVDLRSALLELKGRKPLDSVHTRRLAVQIEGETRYVTIAVRAVSAGHTADARGFYLMTFDETSEPSPVAPVSSPPGGIESVQKLEEELQRTKEHLAITVEQYETSTEELRASNEELQAINEELRSATEELETSKEELQSINEELSTVNQEYKDKIEEVGRVNADLQNLMAAIEIGTIFLDRSLQIKRYTPQVLELFNIAPSDIGRPLEHFTHHLDYPNLTADAQSVLRTLRTIEREVRAGDDRWYLARLLPYRSAEDRIDGVVVTFVDITMRRRQEEQVRQRSAEFQQRAEMLDMAQAFILDADHNILLWNSKCRSVYEFSSEEAIGKNADELLKTEFPVAESLVYAQLQATGQWEGELVHVTKHGRRVEVASHWILHRDEQNQAPVIVEMEIDISERRRAEASLREAHRNTDRFLATLAHELRNPVAAIRNGLTIMRRAESNSSNAARAFEIVDRQVAGLTRLVDDMVDVERLRHGQIRLQKSSVELRAIVDAGVEMAQPRIESGGHTLKVTIPAEPIRFEADLTRLAQVLSNLLDNAAKYTPKGGTIELTAERVADEVVIKVRDNGMGIRVELLPKLFELYAQGQPLPGTVAQGFGVGLTLVRQIVELHGGAISAASDGEGKGSEFTIRLPLGAAPGK